MTEEDRPSGAETDWLASCTECYGYGYTREQAITAMLAHLDMRSTDLQVDLIEHVGNVEHGLHGFDVDTLVTHEVIELPGGRLPEAIGLAREMNTAAQMLVDSAETIETSGGVESKPEDAYEGSTEGPPHPHDQSEAAYNRDRHDE